MMKARHLFSAHSGNADSARKKTRPTGRMLQMKHCNSDILPLLAKTPLFAGIPEHVLASLAVELDICVRDYEADEVVTHECASASEVVSVLSGRLRVFCCGAKDDARHLVHVLGPGEVYGASLPALDVVTESPALVVASERTRILALKVANARRLVRSGTCPTFVANLYAASVRQGFNAWRKLSILSSYEIADRVRAYLRWRNETGDAEPLRLPDLAAYLGVNRTSLYRALGRLGKNEMAKIVR